MSTAEPFDVAIFATRYKAQYGSRHQCAQPATAHRYTDWLEKKVGSHKAALYINKHTHFFLKTEI